MKDSIKNRKKKFLALCLSVMMFSSVGALAACSDDKTDSSSSSSSSSSTSEVKDDGLIKNAGFETFNDDNAINTSATGWSRSVNSATSGSALSSKAASGIIDLSVEGWKNLTGSYYEDPTKVNSLTEEEAEKVWDKLTVRDKLAYYDQWKEDNSDGKIAEDLSFYETINIDTEDIPAIERFETHHKEGEEGYGEDSKVLMIHNEYPEKGSSSTYKALGTAQKYTSSSTVTVKAGTAAKFSVWVKTLDLQSSATTGSAQDAVGKGAYISVTNSVGGKSLDAYKIENINTETMDEGTLSNGWKQYTFLLKGSSYADTTFSLVLGLGQVGGTYRGEYVNGYAFFDDIECELISNETYVSTLGSLSIDPSDIVGFGDEGEDKVVDLSKTENADKTAFAMDFYGDFSAANEVLGSVSGKATTSTIAGETVSSLAGQNPAKWLDGGFDGTNDVTKVYANAAALGAEADGSSNEYLKRVYADYFENNNFAKDKETLLILSAGGAAYTAESAHEFKFVNPTDASEQVDYLAISFFVKTSDLNGYTGAGITLVDGKNKTSFASIDTTDIEPIEIEDDEDVYEGWQQCFFFVENASDNADATFSLSFNFGPTAIEESTAKDSYHPGFAAFTDFKVYSMTEDEYASAQSGTYAKLVSVKADKKDEATAGTGFDTAKGTPSNAIETGLAQLQNYRGVYSDSAYITGSVNGSTEENLHKNAGLLNKEYFTDETEGYYATASGAWFDGIKSIATDTTDATSVWNSVFGKNSTQPLLIWNDGSNGGKSYGYIGAATALSANTYKAVSVRVKVGGSANAAAYLYLIDTDSASYGDTPKTFDKTLSIGRNLTYWYDDNGNICTGDPAEKATQVAFKLQKNGLYKANPSWDGYAKLTDAEKNGYFANLEAYSADPVTKHLMVATSGASHNYSDYWNNEGMDGVAYYYNALNGNYYADRALTVPVSSLSTIDELAPRYAAIGADNQALMAKVTNTNGEWKTVTFYLHTGDMAKNYRLEVWSGARDGAGNAAGDYVIFDANNPGDASGNFSGLIAEYEDEVAEENKFSSVFSYFDTANYLRYNANLDENKIGNLYEDNYTPSANAEGVAYLKYETESEYTVFADYQYSEKAVAASAVEDDSDDATEDTEEEPETNIWLLVSSLVIALVLLIVIVLVVARKVAKKLRKKKAMQAGTQGKKSKK